MGDDEIDRLIATIEELERLFAGAKDDPSSPAWQAMQQRLAEMQEQVARLNPH